MKQTQKAKRQRGAAGGRHVPPPAGPRDPDIVHVHRIALRGSRPGTGRAGSGRRTPSGPIRGR